MKQAISILMISGYFLWPACQHPEVIDTGEPAPVDTMDALSCEDTIEINFPGGMENGSLSAIKTCRAWKASGSAHWPGAPYTHLNVSARTYFPFIKTNGDTVFLNAEGFSMLVPRKKGIFPITSIAGIHQDSVTCFYAYLDVDVAIADWLVDDKYPDNRLEVTELDLNHKRVKGKFNIHFKIDTLIEGYYLFPATLYFHQGVFDLEILE